MRIALAALIFAGCDQVYGLTGRDDDDAGTGSDGNIGDADPDCVFGPFDPTIIYSLAGFSAGTFDPAMSNDQLELFYVVQNRATALDIRYAKRQSLISPWDTGNEILGLNSLADDADPTITADGTSLLFVSSRDAGMFQRAVYEMTRESIGEQWSIPQRRAGITVNAHSIDISADGTSLYVMDENDVGGALHRFDRAGIARDFTSRTVVGTGAEFPSVSSDRSELYYHREQDGIYGLRLGPAMTYIDPVRIVTNEVGADLSHDGLRLLYQTTTGVSYIQRECVSQ